MSGHTFFVRCGDCYEMYDAEVNLLDGEPLWFRPKIKRGGCKHVAGSAEAWMDGRWQKEATA